MKIVWSSEPESSLREEWDDLVLHMEKPEVFYTWEWASAVTHAYRSSLRPWIATAYESGKLVGVAALARLSGNKAAFLTGTTADYCDFISMPSLRQEFVERVLQDLKHAGISSVVLANLPGESASVEVLRKSGSFKSFLRTGYLCGQVRFGSEQEREWVTQSLLKKKK